MNCIRSKKRHINIVTSSCIHQSINPTACINFFKVEKSKCKHNNIKTIFSSGQGNTYFLHYFSIYSPYETFFCIYYTCLWIFVHLSITETLLHRWNSLILLKLWRLPWLLQLLGNLRSARAFRVFFLYQIKDIPTLVDLPYCIKYCKPLNICILSIVKENLELWLL